VTWLLEAYSDRRTYGALGYLLVGLPLGVFGFVVVVTGLSTGLGLLVTLLGIPILVLTLLFVRAFAGLYRQVAWSMLQAPLPRQPSHRVGAQGTFWQRLRDLITSRQTWRELAFALASLPLGVIGFSLAVILIALMLSGFAQPILTAAGVETQIGTWTIDTLPESLVYLPVSLLFLAVGPRILLGLGAVAGRVAAWFLGHIGSDDLKRAVVQSLATDGELDGFAILDHLQLRFGANARLSPTRLQATLLALESSGQVSVRPGATGGLYRLNDQT
jgi:hypothetical protein